MVELRHMKSWQAWTVTVCAILICIVQLYQGLCLLSFNYQMGKMADGAEKELQKVEKDWDEAIRKAKEPSGLDRFLPEKPKARATRNNGQ